MIGMQGVVQKEGLVIHVIISKVVDYTPLLCSIGQMDFPHRPSLSLGAVPGGEPDSHDLLDARSRHTIQIKARNFH